MCASCWRRHAPIVDRCSRCAVALAPGAGPLGGVCGSCRVRPPPFDAATARVDYAPPWDRLVAGFKFRGALELASRLAEAIEEALAAGGGGGAVERIVPVPLAAARLRERGANQAWEVARRLARRLGIAADAGLALRIRETAPQLDLPVAARAGNVRGAFAIEPRRRAEVQGLRVAIVDDVMTTGSTAAELAATLKQAGAAEVAVWVFARTPPPGDG